MERVRDAVAEKGRALDNDRDRAQKAADKNLLGFVDDLLMRGVR